MRLSFLKYQTKSILKSNQSFRGNVPYAQAKSVGIVFTVEDKSKHDIVKEFVRKLELEGKQITVITYLPKNRENHEFMFDFFTEKDVSFFGSITSESALRFANTSFDFLFYLDTDPNPLLLNVIARSKAKCRVGKFFDKGQPYFELMLEVKTGTQSLIDAIYTYASKLH